MRIFLTGATGFIGRALCTRLAASGHALCAWVRSPERARPTLPRSVTLVEASPEPEALSRALEGIEAVVNLAGEPLFPKRWTSERKTRFEESRVALTRALVEAMRREASPPRVLISASAVGYYGDRGDERLTEESTPGEDFLAHLCLSWEGAALEATDLGVRVVTPRIGYVLGLEGGLLGQLLLPFKFGAGGRLGAGEHYMSWIHQSDLLRLLEAMLTDVRYQGAVNAVAPNPVTNREFTRALGRALRRPALVPVPAAALHAALGEAAHAILSSQRVEPRAALALGFRFEHPELEPALRSLLASKP